MSSAARYYQEIVLHYEQCFKKYGTTAKGVDWPNETDAQTRYEIMLGICAGMKQQSSLLDLGCGYGGLLDYIESTHRSSFFAYQGIDLSLSLVAAAKQRHPNALFESRDILIDPLPPKIVDYVIMNGLFTEKRNLSSTQMETFLIDMLKSAFASARFGIAFNIMNHHVDWYRDELFYLPFDQLVSLLKKHLTRHISIRADYGLYEYTVYAYTQANHGQPNQ